MVLCPLAFCVVTEVIHCDRNIILEYNKKTLYFVSASLFSFRQRSHISQASAWLGKKHKWIAHLKHCSSSFIYLLQLVVGGFESLTLRLLVYFVMPNELCSPRQCSSSYSSIMVVEHPGPIKNILFCSNIWKKYSKTSVSTTTRVFTKEHMSLSQNTRNQARKRNYSRSVRRTGKWFWYLTNHFVQDLCVARRGGSFIFILYGSFNLGLGFSFPHCASASFVQVVWLISNHWNFVEKCVNSSSVSWRLYIVHSESQLVAFEFWS